MKKHIIYIGLIFFIGNSVLGQQISCTELLLEVQTAFDEGKIHLIDEKLKSEQGLECLKGGDSGLSNEELTQAYRLLTLAYLQLDEPIKADAMFLKLLEVNPEYQINQAIDPIEFINLYGLWRTKPIVKIQAKGGSNVAFFNPTERVNVFDDAREYTPTPGAQFGAGLEFDLSKFFTKDKFIKDKWLLNSEFFFSTKRLTPTYSSNILFSDVNPQVTEYKYSSFDLRALLNYSFINGTKFKLYGTLGISGELSIENSDQLTGGERSGQEGTPMESTDKDQSDKFLGFGAAGVGGAHLRYKVGLPWLLADIRYNYNFIQEVQEGTTWNNSSDIITFGTFVHPKGYLSYISINLGVSVPIYKPKKLIQ